MNPRDDQTRRPVRVVVGSLVLLAAVWYLFFAETAADNNVFEGVAVLVRGFIELPRLLLDTTAYASFWSFVTESEGFAKIGEHTVEHVKLVMTSMVWASAISIVLGVLTHRVKQLRAPILGVASVLLTIPSLAMFAIFISIPSIGIGDRGPILALILYSILPILRNTITGLESVDPAVIESAKGMGLNARQRLRKVELPLAWPIILTGLRVATLLNVGLAAIAVLVGGSGLGRYINDGLQRFPDQTSVERMWIGVLACIALALVFDLAFSLVRRLTTSKGLRS